MKNLLLFWLLPAIFVFSQSPATTPITPSTPSATSPNTVNVKPEPSPIPLPKELQEPVKTINKEIEIAQLKKENIILQLRLLLTIPNDYQWDEVSLSFKPPPKKDMPAKP